MSHLRETFTSGKKNIHSRLEINVWMHSGVSLSPGGTQEASQELTRLASEAFKFHLVHLSRPRHDVYVGLIGSFQKLTLLFHLNVPASLAGSGRGRGVGGGGAFNLAGGDPNQSLTKPSPHLVPARTSPGSGMSSPR